MFSEYKERNSKDEAEMKIEDMGKVGERGRKAKSTKE